MQVGPHSQSAANTIVYLPIGVLMAFIVMSYQGVNANIMSGDLRVRSDALHSPAVVLIKRAV
jgi:copper/silver efflux system protein